MVVSKYTSASDAANTQTILAKVMKWQNLAAKNSHSTVYRQIMNETCNNDNCLLKRKMQQLRLYIEKKARSNIFMSLQSYLTE